MISAAIFDLDGTLTKIPSPWRHVHERLGVWESIAYAHLDRWLEGRLTYEEFCTLDTSLWSGKSVDEIYGYLDEIEFNRHVPEIVRLLVSKRIPSIIISSGFHYVASKLQRQCGWEPLIIYANELTEGPTVRINVSGDFASPISKRALAQRSLDIVGSRMSETLAVSDSPHDLEQLCGCGYKIQIRAEDDLLQVWDPLESTCRHASLSIL